MEPTSTTPATPASSTPAPAPGEEFKAMSAEQFKARLDRERDAGLKAALVDLGFKDLTEAKSFAEGARKKAESEKSELQKAQEQAAALKAQADRATILEGTLKKTASRELAGLPEAARKAIVDAVGEDPHAQLDRIEFLRASGLLSEAAPRPLNPSTTSAARGPAPIKPAAEQNAYEKWQSLKAANPQVAAHFYQSNRVAIEAARPKAQQ